MPENRPQQQKPVENREEKKEESRPGMSLKDLKPREAAPKPRHQSREGVNISDLKSAISQALDSYLEPRKSDSGAPPSPKP